MPKKEQKLFLIHLYLMSLVITGNKTNIGEHELYFFDADSYSEYNLDYVS